MKGINEEVAMVHHKIFFRAIFYDLFYCGVRTAHAVPLEICR